MKQGEGREGRDDEEPLEMHLQANIDGFSNRITIAAALKSGA